MRTWPSRIEPSYWILLALVMLACASSPTAVETAGVEARTIVVAPLNVTSSLPTDLESSSEMVEELLVAHIESYGKAVDRLDFRSGRALWIESTKQVVAAKMPSTYENAAHFFAGEVGRHKEFDALILSTIFVQNARVRGKLAKWDGAMQPLEEKGERPREADRLSVADMDAKAASILVTIIDPQGKILQQKTRGLELIQHLEFIAETRYARMTFAIEDDIPALEDADRVREGIAQALSPFLAIEPSEAPPTLHPDNELSPDR